MSLRHTAARRALSLALVLFAAPSMAQTTSAKPPVPVGRDPGGIAIALISTGIDYTKKDIAERLARDGEGEVIGLDLVDGDNRPFAAEPTGTAAANALNGTELARQTLAAYRFARLVPIRIAPGDGGGLARALAFAATTPARIVAVPVWGGTAENWELFRQVATQASRLLIVVPAGNPDHIARGLKQWPAALRLPNLIAVAPASEIAERGGPPRPGSAFGLDAVILPRGSSLFGQLPNAPPRNAGEAVALAAGLAACAQHRAEVPEAIAARRQLLALANSARAIGDVPALDAVCLYGGTRY